MAESATAAPTATASESGGSRKQARRGGPGFSQKNGGYLPDAHRKLPQNLDAEKGVLASVLRSPNDVLGICVERISPEHFHHPAHVTIYETMVELWKNSTPIDIITVNNALADRGLLDSVGGPAVVSEIFMFITTAANAEYYLEIVREKFLLRQIIQICTEYAARCYDEQGDVKLLLDEVEAKVLGIGEERFKGELPDLKQQVMKAIDSIEKLYQNKGGITGIPTGFQDLDRMTNGLQGSEMIVIAARPSVGKTALAMNIAEHVAMHEKKAVGIFSLEMSCQQLVQRLLCARARIDMKCLRDGIFGKQDLPKLARTAGDLAQAKMYIDDTPGISILELRAKTRRMRDRFGIELVVIDYLQLLRSPSRRGQENRQIEIAEISNGIKALAKELDVPIIVLAQLNRQPEAREGGKPRLSDLRESGSIEQDADLVGLLVRSEMYEKDEEAREEKAGEAELIIAKQRNGPVGEVPLTFLKQFTRFESRAVERDQS